MSKEILVAFQAITGFLNDLGPEFTNHNKPLKLYKRLVNNTKLSHLNSIEKHVELFKQFCIQNKDCILEKKTELQQSKIIYTVDKIFIDFNYIFKKADSETIPFLWQHLLTISAIVNPSSNAKQLLKEIKEEPKVGLLDKVESKDVMADIFSKIGEHAKPGASPMDVIGSVFQSGAFTDIIKNMQMAIQSGQLDINKMLGMVGNISDKSEFKNVMEAIPQLANSISKQEEK